MACFSPSWASLVTNWAPDKPRATRLRSKPGQKVPPALGPTSSPRPPPSPVPRTPMATAPASLTTRPPARTLTNVASSQR